MLVQVGIAFSRRLKAQNIGLIIPVPVIQRFLTEFERHGKVTFIEPGLTVNMIKSRLSAALQLMYHTNTHAMRLLLSRSRKWRASRCASITE
jgi:hypothetical protein